MMQTNNSETLKLPNSQPVLRVKTLPNDANASGDIFGGWLMAHVDIAGAIAASDRARGHVVTVAVQELRLLKPIFVYDLVSFYATVIAVGHTSLTVKVEVFAQRRPPNQNQVVKVSDATLVYVAVSEPGVKREVPKA